jgi:GGDEF domain-containing protein
MLIRAERHNFAVALLLTDIDHFKKINDTYGHPTGDQVLRRVAALLAVRARKIDITARYGGEEFALVLEATGREGAIQLAERIRQEIGDQTSSRARAPFPPPCRWAARFISTTAGPKATSSRMRTRRCTPPNTGAATGPCASANWTSGPGPRPPADPVGNFAGALLT